MSILQQHECPIAYGKTAIVQIDDQEFCALSFQEQQTFREYAQQVAAQILCKKELLTACTDHTAGNPSE